MIFYFYQLPKVIHWHDAITCKGKVSVDQLQLLYFLNIFISLKVL